MQGGNVVAGGQSGYQRLLLPAHVAAWNEALAALEPDELRARFDATAMMEQAIYPSI